MNFLSIFLASIVLLSNIGQAYDVIDSTRYGFTIKAGNLVFVSTPEGKNIQVTKIPFVGSNLIGRYSIAPVEPIVCSWDPSGNWVCIFITVRQVTEIDCFDLKSKSLLSTVPGWIQRPDWYSRPQLFEHTKPKKWVGNRLLVDSTIKFRNGEVRHLAGKIVVTDRYQYFPDPSG